MARGGNWVDELPIVMLELRSVPNENGISPFSAVTGQAILMPNVTFSGNPLTINNEYVENLARKMQTCLLYTSPSPRDGLLSRMPSSA